MSALASEELRGSLLPALDRLGRAIGGYLAQDPMRAMDLQAMLQSAPTIEGGAQELGSFLTLLQQTAGRDSAELVAAVGEAQAALNRAVVAYALGTAYTSDAANQYYLLAFRALSAWLPVSPEDYANRAPDFAKSRFYRDAPAWGGWLKSVYGEPGRD
jgi:hypothetical protein